MSKGLNKIKFSLAAIWASISSFPFKALGREIEDFQTEYWILPSKTTSQRGKEIDIEAPMQWIYWVPFPSEPAPITAIKIAQMWLAAIIFIVWIISFIKIRKIDDKSLKKKKIKRTIVILLAILFVILLMSVAIRLLKKYNI